MCIRDRYVVVCLTCTILIRPCIRDITFTCHRIRDHWARRDQLRTTRIDYLRWRRYNDVRLTLKDLTRRRRWREVRYIYRDCVYIIMCLTRTIFICPRVDDVALATHCIGYNWARRDQLRTTRVEYLRWRWKDDVRLTLDRLCLLYTSPSPRDQRGSRMPSSA